MKMVMLHVTEKEASLLESMLKAMPGTTPATRQKTRTLLKKVQKAPRHEHKVGKKLE